MAAATLPAPPSSPPGEGYLTEANARLEGKSATEVIEWAFAEFGERLVMSTSFGAHSACMIHLATQVAPGIPVILIDTGYLFDETYAFAASMEERFNLTLHVASAKMTAARQEALYGKLWEQGDEGVQRYLRINKVEPMHRALVELDALAWMAGLRGGQTKHRASLRRVEIQNDRVKVHPILPWSPADVEQYLKEHDLPLHPLVEQGYRSIGDWHSTLPTLPGQDPREGRMLGQKKECGLHLPLSPEQNASLKSSGL